MKLKNIIKGAKKTLTALATTIALYSSPSQAQENSLLNVNNSVDYLVITTTNFFSEAATLCNYRSSQGLESKFLDLQDIYDEFNYGITDPRAIKSFLGHTHYNWQKAPRYIVFLGEGSLDYLNYLGNNDSVVPPIPVANEFGQFGSDSPLSDVDSGGHEEIAVGRIPIANSQEFTNFFNKLFYFEQGGSWKTNGLAVADVDPSPPFFTADSDNFIQNCASNIVFEKNYLQGNSIETVKSNTIESLNSGKGVFIYSGHADIGNLGVAPPYLFADSDISYLTNRLTSPLFISMSCLSGNFSEPGLDSLGEKMLTNPNGAVAIFAASDLQYAGDNIFMGRAIASNLFYKKTSRIGDAIIAASQELGKSGRQAVFQSYNLLGDPATAFWDINSPRPQIEIPEQIDYSQWKEWAFPPIHLYEGYNTQSNQDLDGDGFLNSEEFNAGTIPFDSSSFLRLSSIKRNGVNVVIGWPSSKYIKDDIEASTNLVNGKFEIESQNIQAVLPENTYTSQTPFKPFLRVKGKRN